MDWLSFAAGALVGWLIEWIIDFFYWRRKRNKWADTEARLRSDLSGSQAVVTNMRAQAMRDQEMSLASRQELESRVGEIALLQVDLEGAQTQVDDLNKRLVQANVAQQSVTERLTAERAALESDLRTLQAQLDQTLNENADLRAQLREMQTQAMELEATATRAASAAAAAALLAETKVADDDLTIIEGIGPKIADLLNQYDIRTFERLADSSVDELEGILRAGGSRFSTANPESWPRQARLAANRDWNRLDALKAQLDAGVRRPQEPKAEEAAATRSVPIEEPADDLTILEGIGPKIAELLNQNGIRTFAQLADTDVETLDAILGAGGSRFSTANPESWPRQARLAANRDWNRLDALKAQLVGGVRRPAAAEDAAAATRSQVVPEPEDDLTIVEGIGPKIDELLKQHGIRTYSQLARADVKQLEVILDEAGPSFRMADPASWPEQASWAAVGNWERLKALQARLNAGRSQD